jgi:hypothetical protein
MAKATLECVLCGQRYTREDIERGWYVTSTLVCAFCYRAMQSMPYERSCFGKPTVEWEDGRVQYGYDPQAIECFKWCPDRHVCRKVVRGDGRAESQPAGEVDPE